MAEVDFQECIIVEFQTLTAMLAVRLDTLDQITISLNSIACSLGAIASLYEHEHRI